MNLKYVGGIVGLIGFASTLFFMFGTTGTDVALQGMHLGAFGLCAIGALVGSILVLRGTTKIGSGLVLLAGLGCFAIAAVTGKPTTIFSGILITIGGIIAFFYKEPVATGSQWRMRRTGPSSGTGSS
jgi:hypothetical protein